MKYLILVTLLATQAVAAEHAIIGLEDRAAQVLFAANEIETALRARKYQVERMEEWRVDEAKLAALVVRFAVVDPADDPQFEKLTAEGFLLRNVPLEPRPQELVVVPLPVLRVVRRRQGEAREVESQPRPAALHVVPERIPLRRFLGARVEEHHDLIALQRIGVQARPVSRGLVAETVGAGDLGKPTVGFLHEADVRQVVPAGVEREDAEVRRGRRLVSGQSHETRERNHTRGGGSFEPIAQHGSGARFADGPAGGSSVLPGAIGDRAGDLQGERRRPKLAAGATRNLGEHCPAGTRRLHQIERRQENGAAFRCGHDRARVGEQSIHRGPGVIALQHLGALDEEQRLALGVGRRRRLEVVGAARFLDRVQRRDDSCLQRQRVPTVAEERRRRLLGAPNARTRSSFSLRSASGSFDHTRSPTVAVVTTTVGMGTAILVTIEPAASTFAMLFSAFRSTRFVV